MKTIINLYGGPGTGKSTICAGLYYHLKMLGYTCEMQREYVKDWVWEKRTIKTDDQTYIFAKQSRKERIYMENDLDFIITDSPLLLSHFYGTRTKQHSSNQRESIYNPTLHMLQAHKDFAIERGYENVDIMLKRTKPFEQKGRLQGEESARAYDKEIKQMLEHFRPVFTTINANGRAVKKILKVIL